MIIIVAPKFLSPGILNSQVLPFAQEISHFEKVVVVLKHSAMKNISYEVTFEIVNSLEKRKIKKYLKVADWVYTRGIIDFYPYFIKKKIYRYNYKIFYDFRGIANEEAFLKHHNIFKKKIIYLLEKYASQNADQLGAVSRRLKWHLIEKFKVKKPIYVNPCCISYVIEKENCEKDKIIKFLYLGGLSVWQRFDDVLELYKQISNQIDASLTVITRETKAAQKIIELAGIRNITLKSLPHNEVLRELPSYDFGFLIRDDILVNNLASPVKFLEYTSHGVIPILTDGIGDFSEEAVKNEIGVTLQSANPIIEKNVLLSYHNNPEIHKRLARYSKGYLWKPFINHHPFLHKKIKPLHN
jgi:glycosyltransferase involved in cell wall biosynthesis